MTEPQHADGRHGLITAVVCLALATVVAAMASLNVALPSIARDTHASLTQLEWIIDAYSLAFASLLLPAGAIGDRFGRRLALLVGLSIFGVGSAVALTTSSATELIALRAVLGLGAALVMPATLSTITSTFPPQQRTRAVGVWVAVAGGAGILGLLASGALLEAFSWRSVFALNVVLAAVSLVGTFRFVPESAHPEAPHLDLGGAAIAVVGLVALVFSVIEAPDEGWLAAQTVIGLVGGLVVIAGFVVWELHQAEPLLNPRIFMHPRLAAGSISIFVQFFAFFGFTFIILQYLQLLRGDSPLLGSVQVLPVAVAMMPMARFASRLITWFGSRWVCVGGLVLIAAGMVVLAQVDSTSSYWLLAGGLVLLGAGMGAAMTPATSAITEGLPADRQGVGSALNDLSRELGGAIGIAVIGSVLDAGYRAHMNVAGLPPAIASQAKASFAIAIRLGEPIAGRAHTAFTTGMHTALITAAVAALAAAVVVAILLARAGDAPEAEVEVVSSTRAAGSPVT
jgi:EmrB/QacA subfamily drug resistance transporter